MKHVAHTFAEALLATIIFALLAALLVGGVLVTGLAWIMVGWVAGIATGILLMALGMTVIALLEECETEKGEQP